MFTTASHRTKQAE